MSYNYLRCLAFSFSRAAPLAAAARVYDGFWVAPGLNVPKQGSLRLGVVEALRKIHMSSLEMATWMEYLNPNADTMLLRQPNASKPADFKGAKKKGGKLAVTLPAKSVVLKLK